MKKIISIVCVLFAAMMVFALPVSAATPYQTYTYSIDGTALNSPDAYYPVKTIDATLMGLKNEATLRKYHKDMAEAYAKIDFTLAEMNAAKLASDAKPDDKNLKNTYDTAKDAYAKAQSSYTDLYNKYSVLGAKTTDLEVDSSENVYLSDTDNNRIIVLDRYYKVKFILSDFYNRQGQSDKFNKPQGVYITDDDVLKGREGKIYVCDTENARIVTFTREGEFIDIIAAPESELLGSSFTYRPLALAVDAYNRLYVISRGAYQGVIVMTDSGDFTGFIGAQKVSVSAWEKIWRMFQTDEQRKNSEQNISTPFNNITLTGDFIYVTIDLSSFASQQLEAITSKTGDFSPVKMLNASGDEIMRRNGFFGPAGEVDHQRLEASHTLHGESWISDVAVGPAKTWTISDQKRSKVFTYDFDGNLLFAFGDMGQQLGNITGVASSDIKDREKGGLVAVTYKGSSLLLLDKSKKSFTVYNRTEYGDVLIQALENQNLRKNDQAIKDWKEILKRNSNFDAAYIGIGNALANENKFDEAIEMYKSAYDTVNYSASYKELRQVWISDYIIWIPILAIAIAFGLAKFFGFANKYNKRVSTSKGKRTYIQELMFVFHVIFHPFDGFWDMKHEKRGSVRAGLTILGVTIVVFYYQAIGQGYVMNPTESYSTIISTAISILVPLALWVVANWCLTTLFDGEGSLKDIFIATTYALAPLALILVPVTIASNFILENEIPILTLFSTIAYVWAGMLIFFGTMVTHDYSFGKNILTTLGTIVGMVCIMFIAILFSTLLGKLVGFVANIVTEIQYRM